MFRGKESKERKEGKAQGNVKLCCYICGFRNVFDADT